MPKLKIVLPSKKIVYLFLIFSILISFYRSTFLQEASNYTGNETIINGIILSYKETTDKLSLTILTNKDQKKEKIIANIYDLEKFKAANAEISYTDIKIGDSITLKGTFQEPLNNTIPNTFNYKNYLYHQRIYYLFTVKEIIAQEPTRNFLYKLQNFTYDRCRKLDNKGYLSMLIYGKKDIEQDIYSSLQKLGVVHLFAISGLHISIFTLALEKLLQKLKVKKFLKTIFILIFLLIYAALINFPASVLRALMMYVFLQISSLWSKKHQISLKSYEILLLSISVLLFLNPHFLYDIGFLYSSLCTFGLTFYNDTTKNYFLKSLKTTYIASLWSLPLTISLNYSYNLLTPIFNLFYVPFISFIFYPICLLTFIFPILLPILKIFIIFLESFTNFFSNLSINIILPKMSLWVIVIYYINVFFLSKYKKVYYHFLNFLLLIIYPYQYNFNKNLKVYYLDVSQGDASILISPKMEEVVMIDTGGLTNDKNYYTAQNIIKFLHSINVKKIDNLIISHGDYDHIGNAFYLVNNIVIKEVTFNNDDFNDLETSLCKILQDKKIRFQKGNSNLQGKYFTWYFLNTELYDNENDNSLVTYLKYQDHTFLFMGDASKSKEEDIIKKYKLPKIDFLKVGHHGSKTSSSKEFIDYIMPKYALISVGRKNKYGHPNKETLEILKNSQIYRTDLLGTIEFEVSKNNFQVKNNSP